MASNKNSGDGCLGFLIFAFILLLGSPFIGLNYLIFGKTEDDKATGLLLLVVGIVVWIIYAVITIAN